MPKAILKLQVHKDKHKKKAMKIASGMAGLNSISMDKDMKLTVTGEFDPVELTEKLRKLCSVEIVSVGPEKEEKKPEEPKPKPPNLEPPIMVYPPPPPPVCYYQLHHPMEAYYYGTSVEEDPNGCVIC